MYRFDFQPRETGAYETVEFLAVRSFLRQHPARAGEVFKR
jgi:hypothetical protein